MHSNIYMKRMELCVHIFFSKKVGIFDDYDVPCTVSDKTFWEHVVPRKPNKTVDRHNMKQHVDMNDHERKALEVFLDKPTIEWKGSNVRDREAEMDGDDVPDQGDNADSVCDDLSVGSCASIGSVGTDMDDELDGEIMNGMDDMMMVVGSDVPSAVANESEQASHSLTTIKDQETALKKLGNVSRYNLDRNCLLDYFKVGRAKLDNVIHERKTEIAKERRRLELLYDAVRFYRKKMSATMAELTQVMSDKSNRVLRESQEWEAKTEMATDEFDIETFKNGGYN